MAGNDAVVGVDFGGLAELDVVRLGFGDLEGGLELVGLYDLGQRGSHGDVLADLEGGGERVEHSADAGTHLKGLLLLLIQVEKGAGLIDLGLRRGKLNLDGVLVYVKLLLAKLVLGGELVGGTLGLAGRDAGDNSEFVKLLVDLGLTLILRVVGVDLAAVVFLSINVLCSVACMLL